MGRLKFGFLWRLAIACFALAAALAIPARAFAAPEHWVTDINGNSLNGASIDVSVIEQGIIFHDIWVLGDRHGGAWMLPVVNDLDSDITLPVTPGSSSMTPVGDERDPISDAYITNHCIATYYISGFVPGHRYQISFCFKENPSAADEYDYVKFGTGSGQGSGTGDGSGETPDPGDTDGSADVPAGGGGDDSGNGSSDVSDAGADAGVPSDSGNASEADAPDASGGIAEAAPSSDNGASMQESSTVGDFSLNATVQDDADVDAAASSQSSTVGDTPAFDGKSLASLGQVYRIASGSSEQSKGGSGSDSAASATVEVTGIAWLWTLLWLAIALALPMGLAARAVRFRRGIRSKSRFQAW